METWGALGESRTQRHDLTPRLPQKLEKGNLRVKQLKRQLEEAEEEAEEHGWAVPDSW